MKWILFILRLFISFMFFLSAVKWYGKVPNSYIALFLLTASIWVYNAMRGKEQ